MDCSLPGSLVLGIFPGKSTGVGCLFLLQEILLTQGSNPQPPALEGEVLTTGQVASEVAQSCMTLCDPMDCSLLGSSIHGIFPGKSTGVGCHFLLQGILLTRGSNPGLPHFRRTLYPLSHLEIPCLITLNYRKSPPGGISGL